MSNNRQQTHLNLSRSNWDLIGNKIADKITKTLKGLQQNNSKTITNEPHKEIHKNQDFKVSITDRKLYALVVTLST